VRPGLIAFGFRPIEPLPRPLDIRPAMALKTRVLQVRDFAPGESVSYGRTFVARRATRAAVLGIGYGHGYSRRLSNRGAVLVRGRRAPIIGRVTMDMTMADVTEIAGVEAGDEAVLFGTQAGATISLEEVAVWRDSINYEVTCDIGRRVARVYLREGSASWVRTLVGEGPSPDEAIGARPRRRSPRR
jgi:alanine racemase